MELCVGSPARAKNRRELEKLGRYFHLVGIGGCGMSGLARLLHEWGATVSGADAARSGRTDDLKRLGIKIEISQDRSTVPETVDRIVRSAAVGEQNPDVIEARRRGVEVCTYAETLGDLLRLRQGVVVAGTHGKTTTTAMMASTLRRGGLDPTYLVGGEVAELPANAGAGTGTLFVVEGCEYDRSFLQLSPHSAIITNLEAEHLDCYPGGIEEIREAFSAFVSRIRPGGVVVIPEALESRLLDRNQDVEVLTFGDSPGADWRVDSVVSRRGYYEFRVEQSALGISFPVRLRVPGFHNLMNALAASALLCRLGLEPAKIAEGLSSFRGVRRRFDSIVTSRAVTLIDDYAHHPTEVRAAVGTALECFPGRRLWVVFQPHLVSRARSFRRQFARELAAADRVVVCSAYRAREEVDPSEVLEEGSLLSREIVDRGADAVFLPDHDSVFSYLKKRCRDGDVVLTLGAGDITLVPKRLARELR